MADDRWSPRTEKLAKKWAETSVVMKWKHYEVAQWYTKINFWLGIPVMFMTAALGTSLFGGALSDNEEVSRIIMYVGAALSFVVTGLHGVLVFLDPGTISQKHLNGSANFDAILHDLQFELAMDKVLRQDAVFFFDSIKRKMSVATKQSPVIPARFWTKRTADIMNGHCSRQLTEVQTLMKECLNEEMTEHDYCPNENLFANPGVSVSTSANPGVSVSTSANPEEEIIMNEPLPQDTTESHIELEDVVAVSNNDNDKISTEEEYEDVMNGYRLQEQLNQELRKIRDVSQQRRFRYQMERIENGNGKKGNLSKPPNINDLWK